MIGPSHRPLPDNTQQSQNPPAGFEAAVPGREQPQTHALDRTALWIGVHFLTISKYHSLVLRVCLGFFRDFSQFSRQIMV